MTMRNEINEEAFETNAEEIPSFNLGDRKMKEYK